MVRWAAGGNHPAPLLTLCLALEALYAGEVHRPREGRAAPDLAYRRSELGALIDPADPQPINGRVRLDRSGIDWRAAFWAEGVGAPVPALGGI